MQQALDSTGSHLNRLRDLMSRFRNQERWITTALQDLQSLLELRHRESSYRRIEADPHGKADALARECAELQREYDELATELVHVRMAISGANEELSDYSSRVLPIDRGRRLGA